MKMTDVLAAIPESPGWVVKSKSSTYSQNGDISLLGIWMNLWCDTKHRPSMRAVEKQVRKLIRRGLVEAVDLYGEPVYQRTSRLKTFVG